MLSRLALRPLLSRLRALLNKEKPEQPSVFDTVLVTVDPATGERGDGVHGIVVTGVREEADGRDHVYVLADLSMISPTPRGWAEVAVRAYREWAPRARFGARIVVASNTGGTMMEAFIRAVDMTVPVQSVLCVARREDGSA